MAANKCSILRVSTTGIASNVDYATDAHALPNASLQRDLGVLVDTKLKFSDHCKHICNRATSLCFRIRRSFCSRNRFLLFKIFKTYVRPILEHDSVVWSPCLKRDVLKVERAQRIFTKFLPGMENCSYLQRLSMLCEGNFSCLTNQG